MNYTKLTIGLALCGLSLAYFLHRYPLALPYAEDQEQTAEFMLQNTGASALMIVDTAVIHAAWDKGRFSQADFSYAWQSILERHVGRFDILMTDQVTEKRLDSSALIVLTESALGSDNWERLSSIISSAINSLIVIADVRDPLQRELNLNGSSRLLTLRSFAKRITEIRQGLPEDNFSVENSYSDHGSSDKLESNDLVSSEELLSAATPIADSIEIALFNQLNQERPFARWHTAPDTSSGIFLMTHDDEGIGDAGLWMNEFEHSAQYRSTTFLLPSQRLSAEGIKQLGELGGVAALHWNRFNRADKGSYDTVSFGRWRPLKQKRNLQAQLEWLEELGAPADYNRNHYFLWDDDYTRTFRILNAHGIRMDFSYGPDLNQKGYLFGSAFPFHPLDKNGAAFTLYETPVTWTENFAGADTNWIAGVLSDNAERFHGVVAPLYHNNTYAWRPDHTTYESWRLSYQLARSSGHRMMNAVELERFLESRRESDLTWELSAGQLIVECTARSDNLSLLIPAETLGRPQLSSSSDAALSSNDYRVDQIRLLNSVYWRILTPATPLRIICDRLEENIIQR